MPEQTAIDQVEKLLELASSTAERIYLHPDHKPRTRAVLDAFNLSTAALLRLSAELRELNQEFPQLYADLIEHRGRKTKKAPQQSPKAPV